MSEVSKYLKSLADWMENPNNEAMILADSDVEDLAIVAIALTECSKLIKEAMNDLNSKERIQKQASMLDDLLISISSSSDEVDKKMAEMDLAIENIKIRRAELNKSGKKIADYKEEQLKNIEDSGITKNYKNLEAPLSTRYCPDHPGVMVNRVDENTWQCELDHKTYNFTTGFKLQDGSQVSGGDVSNQTKTFDNNEFTNFDTRESKLSSM